MSRIENLIPDYVIERSFGFKTAVLIIGALLLLSSSLLRPEYPVLWMVPFLGGALIEWLIIATVYIEMNQLESTAMQAHREIEEAVSEIETMQREIQETKHEIDDTKDNIFSFISDSQGIGANDSIEDRLSRVEDEVGVGRGAVGNSLAQRVSDLERELDDIDTGRNRF